MAGGVLSEVVQIDYLDIVDEMTETDKTAFKDAAKDLSVSSDQLNAAMDYCAWLMKVMDNAYGTGSYDLIAGASIFSAVLMRMNTSLTVETVLST